MIAFLSENSTMYNSCLMVSQLGNPHEPFAPRSSVGFGAEFNIVNRTRNTVSIYNSLGELVSSIEPTPTESKALSGGQYGVKPSSYYDNIVEITIRMHTAKNARVKKNFSRQYRITPAQLAEGPVYVTDGGFYVSYHAQAAEIMPAQQAMIEAYSKPHINAQGDGAVFRMVHNVPEMEHSAACFVHIGSGIISQMSAKMVHTLPLGQIVIIWNMASMNSASFNKEPEYLSCSTTYEALTTTNGGDGVVKLALETELVAGINYQSLAHYVKANFGHPFRDPALITREHQEVLSGRAKEEARLVANAATVTLREDLEIEKSRADLLEHNAERISKERIATENVMKRITAADELDARLREAESRREMDEELRLYKLRREREDAEEREDRRKHERSKRRVWVISTVGILYSALKEPFRALVGLLARHMPSVMTATGLTP